MHVSSEAPHEQVNLVELMDSAPVGGFHFRVLLLCVAIAMLDGFDTQAIAFVAPALSGQGRARA